MCGGRVEGELTNIINTLKSLFYCPIVPQHIHSTSTHFTHYFSTQGRSTKGLEVWVAIIRKRGKMKPVLKMVGGGSGLLLRRASFILAFLLSLCHVSLARETVFTFRIDSGKELCFHEPVEAGGELSFEFQVWFINTIHAYKIFSPHSL